VIIRGDAGFICHELSFLFASDIFFQKLPNSEFFGLHQKTQLCLSPNLIVTQTAEQINPNKPAEVFICRLSFYEGWLTVCFFSFFFSFIPFIWFTWQQDLTGTQLLSMESFKILKSASRPSKVRISCFFLLSSPLNFEPLSGF